MDIIHCKKVKDKQFIACDIATCETCHRENFCDLCPANDAYLYGINSMYCCIKCGSHWQNQPIPDHIRRHAIGTSKYLTRNIDVLLLDNRYLLRK